MEKINLCSSLFKCEDLKLINKIRIPPITDPVSIQIYWFQVHSYAEDSTSLFFKPHKHSFCEAHFVLKGTVDYQIGNQNYSVSAGQFILITPDAPHTQLQCSENMVKLSLSFEILSAPDNPLSENMRDTLSKCPLHEATPPEVPTIISCISSQAKRVQILSPFAIRNEIFALISEIYYCSSAKEKRAQQQLPNDTVDPRYITAKKFIDDNISVKIHTEDIARHVHLCSKQLNRIFQINGEQSVFAYISEKKCQLAKELLTSTNLSIQEIGDRLGFSDEFYFNRCFTQKTGITPLKFRKINGKLIKNKIAGESQNEVQ